MRLKWFLVTFLCVTLLHSACVVRAEHEDYVDEDQEVETAIEDTESAAGNEDLTDTVIHTADDSEDPPPPPPEQEEVDVEEIEQQHAQPEEETEEVSQVEDIPQGKVRIGGRKSGNYYFDDDYYNGNYDVDVNYDWSKWIF